MSQSQNSVSSKSGSPVFYQAWFYLSLLAFVGFVFVINNIKLTENDTWWNIAMGRWMVQHHQVYRTEIFSQPALGRPFIAHEWLSGILFYLFSDNTGVLLSYFKLILVLISCLPFVFFEIGRAHV